MLASQIPAKFPIPFANSAGIGQIRTIPTASQISITPGAASLTDGFPPLNFIPVPAGGVAPFGQDMNGILKELSANDQWLQAGGFPVYDSAFSTAIGGYPNGAVLRMANMLGLWVSTADNNTTNPDTSGAGWMPIAISPNFMTSINGGQISGFRNKIINGDMAVSQVNGGTAVTPTVNAYITDQFLANISQPSKLTFQQVVDAPAGFKYSTKVTVAAQYAPVAADIFRLFQRIEGQNIIDFQLGTSGAVTLATSNYIKGSVAGNYAVSILNESGSRSYVGTMAVTTNWARAVIVLVGDTAGTWATDNTCGMTWCLDLGSGSNTSTTANIWQAGGGFTRTPGSVTFVNQVAGSTLNITGVQLEQVSAGATQGTAFEHIPYATQRAWCQKYLEPSPIMLPVYSQSTTASKVQFPIAPKRGAISLVTNPVAMVAPSMSATFASGGNVSLPAFSAVVYTYGYSGVSADLTASSGFQVGYGYIFSTGGQPIFFVASQM